MGVKRILVIAVFALALPMVFTGCQKKAAFPNCKRDSECRVDATGAEINGVCYMGKCEECVQDADCTDLKQCVNNRCLSACQADADCGAEKHCEANYCISDCTGNENCPGDHVCALGRCVAQGGEGAGGGVIGECQGIERIHFDFDRFEVKPEYKEQVDRLAQCLEENPNYEVKIEGHTDNLGTPSYNMALGQKRADAVRNYLRINKGIASKRVKTQSYGEQRPLNIESSDNAREQNRRAEFILGKH